MVRRLSSRISGDRVASVGTLEQISSSLIMKSRRRSRYVVCCYLLLKQLAKVEVESLYRTHPDTLASEDVHAQEQEENTDDDSPSSLTGSGARGGPASIGKRTVSGSDRAPCPQCGYGGGRDQKVKLQDYGPSTGRAPVFPQPQEPAEQAVGLVRSCDCGLSRNGLPTCSGDMPWSGIGVGYLNFICA